MIHKAHRKEEGMYRVRFGGLMGVPTTLLGNCDPKQFEILGKIDSGRIDEYNLGNPIVNGVNKFRRIAIRRRKE